MSVYHIVYKIDGSEKILAGSEQEAIEKLSEEKFKPDFPLPEIKSVESRSVGSLSGLTYTEYTITYMEQQETDVEGATAEEAETKFHAMCPYGIVLSYAVL